MLNNGNLFKYVRKKRSVKETEGPLRHGKDNLLKGYVDIA